MLSMKSMISGSVCAALLTLGSTAVLSQEAYEGEPTQSQTEQQQPVTDSELALYAQAAQKVAQMQQGLQENMQQAATAEEAQAIQAEGQESIVNAVQSFGMTVEEYNRIAQLSQTDPELRSRLGALLQQQ